MTATKIITRASVGFVMQEDTENVPKRPGAATDAVSLLDGFAMAPAIAQLQTTLLRNSIGPAKSIAGLEAPTVNWPQYLKGSGTEGTAPEWNLFAKAAFGNEYVATTEYATTGVSTVTVLACTAASTNLKLGQPLLIKDPVNGYRIRHIASFPTADSIELSFQLPPSMNPASGTDLGKAVTWYPANTGHISLTAWLYLGNGGATEMVSGCRVTSLAISADAGKLITMDVQMGGLGFYFDPILTDATHRYIDFTDDSGTYAAAVASKEWKTPIDLAAGIQTAMNSTATTKVHTVVYQNDTGLFKFTATGTVLSLLWNTGANTANTIATRIGFSAGADSTGTAAATGYTSATAQSFAAPYTPSYDSSDAVVAKNQEFMIGDAKDYVCFEPSSVKYTLADTKTNQESICAESGVAGSTVTARDVTMDVVALLGKYDADKMSRLINNTALRAQYSWGTKAGGDWLKGFSGGIYLASATITKFDAPNLGGYISMNLSLKGFVDNNGNPETFMGTV